MIILKCMVQKKTFKKYLQLLFMYIRNTQLWSLWH